jgi:hypothetical protein
MTGFLARPSAGLVARLVLPALALCAAGAAFLPAAAASPAGPTALTRPSLIGAMTEGAKITVSLGAWKGSGHITRTYRWYRCTTMGMRCALLRGVEGRSHLLGPNDVGHTLSVAVRSTDETGSRTVFAGLAGPIGGGTALVSTARPALSGAAVGTGTLHVDSGGWKPRPSGFTYQWARCNANGRGCVPIQGATGASYQLGEGDLGHALAAIVQARLGVTTQAVFSFATLPALATAAPTAQKQKSKPATAPAAQATAPSNAAAPLVGMVVQGGGTLSAAPGSWTAPGAISYAYQWYRCDASGAGCKPIRGATDTRYAAVARDVGQTLGFSVRASNPAGSRKAYASLVGPVAPAAATLVSTAQPLISGSPSPGQTVQVSTGGWTQTPASFAYQWQRCNRNGRLCAPIAGATSGSQAQDALSVAARVQPPAPTPTAPPTVSGSGQEGERLTGTQGSWANGRTLSYTFNWYRCDASGAHCKSIHGATKSTYVEVAKDVGQTLGFAVRATDGGGTTTAYASLVGPIAPAGAALVATEPPAITGTASPGQLLQLSTGTWSQPPASFAYQWLRCNSNGRLCVPIAGATGSTYTVTSEDAGNALVASVTGTFGDQTQAVLSGAVALQG